MSGVRKITPYGAQVLTAVGMTASDHREVLQTIKETDGEVTAALAEKIGEAILAFDPPGVPNNGTIMVALCRMLARIAAPDEGEPRLPPVHAGLFFHQAACTAAVLYSFEMDNPGGDAPGDPQPPADGGTHGG